MYSLEKFYLKYCGFDNDISSLIYSDCNVTSCNVTSSQHQCVVEDLSLLITSLSTYYRGNIYSRIFRKFWRNVLVSTTCIVISQVQIVKHRLLCYLLWRGQFHVEMRFRMQDFLTLSVALLTTNYRWDSFMNAIRIHDTMRDKFVWHSKILTNRVGFFHRNKQND